MALLLVGVAGLGLLPVWSALWARHQYRAAEEADRKREFVTAREHIDKYLWLRPRDADAHLLAARVARRAGNFPLAEEHLARCAALIGSSKALALERALLHAQQGDLPAPIEAQFRIWVDEGHPDSLLILEVVSQQFMRTYRLSDAADALDRWLALAPDDVWALMRRGWVYERFNRFEAAMADYEHAVAVAPDLDGPRLRLAYALLHGKNDAAEALKHFETLYQHGLRGHAVLLGLAQCRRQLGDQAEAERLLDDLLATHPDDPAALMEMGRMAYQMGRPEEAVPRLEEAIRLDASAYQAHFVLYQCLEQLGRRPEAEEHRVKADQIKADLDRMQRLTSQLQKAPRDASVRCEIARLFLRLGEPREAVAWFHRALELDPSLESAHRGLADYYDSVHEPDKAEEQRRLAAQGKRNAGPP
jgi:tetratricopeptide (TPR) repeat protein